MIVLLKRPAREFPNVPPTGSARGLRLAGLRPKGRGRARETSERGEETSVRGFHAG